MTQKVYVWFDMDGTVYNLYDIPNWLPRLRAEDATVYSEAGYERKTIKRIREAVCGLQMQDVRVGILTWYAMGATEWFNAETKKHKIHWAHKYFPEALYNNGFHGMPYGTPKHEIAYKIDPNGIHILVDDNNEVRKHWRAQGKNFLTINAKRGYIKQLKAIANM